MYFNLFHLEQVAKKDFSYEKAKAQLEILPDSVKAAAADGLENCKDVPKKYKDLCDKMFFMAKCLYENNPEAFFYP